MSRNSKLNFGNPDKSEKSGIKFDKEAIDDLAYYSSKENEHDNNRTQLVTYLLIKHAETIKSHAYKEILKTQSNGRI